MEMKKLTVKKASKIAYQYGLDIEEKDLKKIINKLVEPSAQKLEEFLEVYAELVD